MLEIKKGIIREELFSRRGIKGYSVDIEGNEEKAIVYPDLIGETLPGDEVLLNTTAVSLNLGSGGYHYVIAVLHSKGKPAENSGHIMKLRYTPMQVKVLSVEEEKSPFRQEMMEAESLAGIPVLVGTLHSMLAPLCLGLHKEGLKLAYVMTDGAALPMAFSRTVDALQKEHLLAGTVTIGHAFGGDLEAVNIYSGLLAAKKVFAADVIIVTMGPGIVGTGTKWGFTGVEQGDILNAVDVLGGVPIAVPRISFSDSRQRHYGLSHHSITVLGRVCRAETIIPLPLLEEVKLNHILGQLQNNGLAENHVITIEDSALIIDLLKASKIPVSTMGRGIDDDQEFFLTLGAAAMTANCLVKGEKLKEVYLV